MIGDVRLGVRCWVGPGAVVSDWAEVGEWGVIAEGAVVPQRAVDDEYRAAWLGFKQIYVELCERFRTGLGA